MAGDDCTASRIAAAARDCIGARFRAHGRDPAIGLDCVGLAAFAYRAGGADPRLPSGYGLRGGSVRDIADRLRANGFVRIPSGTEIAGDLFVLQPGARQIHFAIHSGRGFVHADLALKRIVERPGAPPWPLLGLWRWRPDGQTGI